MKKEVYMNDINISMGKHLPMGSSFFNYKGEEWVNFSLFSRHASFVVIAFFKNAADEKPIAEFPMFKTGDIWHISASNIEKPIYYSYRVDGSADHANGHRYDKKIFLLDPCAKDITDNSTWDLDKKINPKAIAYQDDFDWQDDISPNIPVEETILYEMHVKGFTQIATDVKEKGNYLGIIEKIPYLKSLGITSLELLPVMQFNQREYAKEGYPTLKNFWGYSTMAFFTPEHSFASNPVNTVVEFKTMVRELHKNNLEVILDVVFNHTNEGNELGPVISFKGIDNSIYYTLYTDKKHYWNYSGCGNTFNCNNVVVANFIVDCLVYWVEEMHVDGFRFDLGTILSRDMSGNLIQNPIVLDLIAEHPLLRRIKLISEPWDAGGGYQVGYFPRGDRFSEWNDRYRDDMRRFWRNDNGLASAFATRLAGSNDLYHNRKAIHSVNYITAHDGFTLNDLVTYNDKHNEANGENNNDGSTNNLSYNFGHEGETDSYLINNIRNRMVKNHILTMSLSIGLPMFVAGDEVKRTQKGNNNAYCQDSDISYFDWSLVDKNKDVLRFFKEALNFRKQNSVFKRNSFYSGFAHGGSTHSDISWYDEHARPKNWTDSSNLLMCRISGDKILTGNSEQESDILILLNPSPNDIIFNLPSTREDRTWFLKADTSEPSPFDFRAKNEHVALKTKDVYFAKSYSSVILTCY